MDIFCTTDMPGYVAQDCGIERAGIIGVGLIDLNESPTSTNLEDASWWTSQIALSPQVTFVIQNTRGEYNGGSPVEEEGFGKESTQITGADHELSFEVEGLIDNRDFWEGANRRKWKLAIATNGDLLYYISSPVTLYAKIMNPKNIKSGAFWAVTCKWQDYSNPAVYNIPVGIFSN